MNKTRGFRPRALGEIAIRCADMATMVTFYEDVIGLERMAGGRLDAITFFRIAEGFGGHTAVLALFQQTEGEQSKPLTGPGSALHHIALSLPFEEQEAVMRWYDSIDQPFRVEQFSWVGWRGIFTQDSEGNTIELVAYDAAMLEASTE
jgi:catechol 2,3-dioxygenase-like lactoylglutathione lyase family enzyme